MQGLLFSSKNNVLSYFSSIITLEPLKTCVQTKISSPLLLPTSSKTLAGIEKDTFVVESRGLEFLQPQNKVTANKINRYNLLLIFDNFI